MGFRPHGRAQVNPDSPRAFGVCDTCGFLYNLRELRWQFQYTGPTLVNLRFLVCDACYDTPQPQLKPVILPPDPIPVANPRVEHYVEAETNYRVTEDGDTRTTQAGRARVTQPSQWVTYTTTSASGTGTTATLLFSGTDVVPVGQRVTVTGLVPALYNGEKTVTASSAGSITYSSVATGVQTTAGTIIVPRITTDG